MAKHNGINFVLVDAIASEAYVTTMVTCLLCESGLIAADLGINEPNDPMEVWAQEFCNAARSIGWSVSKNGSIVCPECNEENERT